MGGCGMIVADTHIIIWKALRPEMLSENAKKAISSANRKEGIIFCEISLWEIAMLMQKKRIRVDSDYQDFIKLLMQSERYVLHGITPEIADCSVKFLPGVSSGYLPC
jgi:PIN domain nuclease of toxin-antitoxin system